MIIELGRTSNRRLNTCCPSWGFIIRAAAADPECPCDFGVVCGSRGQEKQEKAFSEGKSNARWGESDHNVMMGDEPWSLGIDLGVYDPDIHNYVWEDPPMYAALASHIMKHAHKSGYHVEWGGTYDLGDGKNDPGHFSLLFK